MTAAWKPRTLILQHEAATPPGLMTAWLVLVQPPLWMTVIGTLTSVALLWWAFRADSQPVADKELQPHTA